VGREFGLTLTLGWPIFPFCDRARPFSGARSSTITGSCPNPIFFGARLAKEYTTPLKELFSGADLRVSGQLLHRHDSAAGFTLNATFGPRSLPVTSTPVLRRESSGPP